jgi:hypothetical protein
MNYLDGDFQFLENVSVSHGHDARESSADAMGCYPTGGL